METLADVIRDARLCLNDQRQWLHELRNRQEDGDFVGRQIQMTEEHIEHWHGIIQDLEAERDSCPGAR